jgi:hypothetical protein
VASFSCVGHDDNKTLSYKTISGGKMRVGSLVRIKQSNIGDKGRFAIVVKMYPNDAVLHVVDTGEVWRYALYNLEVLCE